ncbi:MAG TPA: GNAT family N-acetyltransferase [Ktedonobacterales bacterium]|jgi:GNAT superfamily N-acetyltransferase
MPAPTPAAPRIRPATAADLPQVGDIYYQNEIEDDPTPPPVHAFAWLAHVLASGRLYVAEDAAGAVIGYGGSIVRGPVAFLTDLFVRPARQSGAIGQALLAAVLPADGRMHCTTASTDPRAQALYTRAGMAPRRPHYWLRVSPEDARRLPAGAITLAATPLDDPALRAWDARVSGRDRPQDFAWWRDGTNGVALWCRRGGERVGYAVAQRRTDASVYHPDMWTIGPVGAADEADAAECALAACAWALAHGAPLLRIAVAGPHPALKPLLDAGARINYVEMYCATRDDLFDPRRYISSGDML